MSNSLRGFDWKPRIVAAFRVFGLGTQTDAQSIPAAREMLRIAA